MTRKNLKSSGKKPLSYNKNRYYHRIILIAILCVTAVVYSNSLGNEFVKYDDDYYVTDNKYIRDFSLHGVKEIALSYTKDELPVTLFSFAADFKLWKLNPEPYHIENLLFHLLNIILVYLLISLIFNNLRITVVVSLLFAFHPFRVESVAWVAERKDMLYSFFFFLSLICYTRYIKNQNKLLMYFLSLTFSILSVLSKFSGVTLPFILVLFDYYFRRKFSIKTIAEKIPFLIIPLLSLIIHFTYKPVYLNQMQESIFSYSFTDRIFLACYSLIYYLTGLFYPFRLSVIHSYPFKTGGLLPAIYYFSPAILLITGLLIIRSIKKTAQFSREFIFSILFFLITISIFLHIVPFGGNIIVAERYTYVSHIGLYIFLAYIFSWLLDNPSKPVQKIRAMVIILGCFFLILSIVITYTRNNVWKNTYTLFSDVIENDTKVPIAYNNRGGSEVLTNNFSDAISDFDKAIAINPEYADAYCNRSVAKLLLNDGKGAIDDLDKAISLNKNFEKAYCNRGHARTMMKDFQGAKEDLDKAININHESFEAWYNKGVLDYEQKKIHDAINDYSESLIINPAYEKAYINRGNIKGELKDFYPAIEDYNKAIEINPHNGSAYLNRGIAKFFLNDQSGACSDWRYASARGDKEGAGFLRQYCR